MMEEICHKKDGECWEFISILPRLSLLVLETLVDNLLTIRNPVVSFYNSARVLFAEQLARR